MTEFEMQAEIVRLNKIIQALMNRAERSDEMQASAFNLFQTTIELEARVRNRTAALEAALRENERMTRALRESEEKFRALVDQSLVGITLHGREGFEYANPGFAAMTGYSVDELMRMGALDITPPDDRSKAESLLRRGFQGLVPKGAFVVRVLRKDGSVMHAEVSGGPPIAVGGVPVLMSVWLDVSERVRAEQEVLALNERLREQAIRDPLTGLYNRRYLDEMLERELHKANCAQYPVSVVMGDLDHFKNINDTYGHHAGDQMLKSFAELVRRHARAGDICCRYGGEEFLLVLPRIAEDQAVRRAEQLRAALASAEVRVGDRSLHATASFGVASARDGANGGDELVNAADEALYEAKRSGRNRVSRSGGEGMACAS